MTVPSDLSSREHWAEGHHWIYPVMNRVIEGIEKGDPAMTRNSERLVTFADLFGQSRHLVPPVPPPAENDV